MDIFRVDVGLSRLAVVERRRIISSLNGGDNANRSRSSSDYLSPRCEHSRTHAALGREAIQPTANNSRIGRMDTASQTTKGTWCTCRASSRFLRVFRHGSRLL